MIIWLVVISCSSNGESRKEKGAIFKTARTGRYHGGKVLGPKMVKLFKRCDFEKDQTIS
jgi:hypothetical protein